MDLISVIIPIYNVDAYLPKTLDSVLAQTYSFLEIILIDDGSTDNSGLICDTYAEKDPRIRVIHKKNGGVSAARNDGLNIAKGEYIGFVDGDDIIERDMYETLILNAHKHNADISICQMDTVNVNGRTELTFDYPSRKIKASEIIKGFFFDPFIKSIMYSQCNKIFSKHVLENVRFAPFRYCEDILFVFEAMMKTSTVYYDKRVGYHYIHREKSAMTSAFSQNRLDYVYAARKVVDICAKNYPECLDGAETWLYQHTLITLRQIISVGKKIEMSDFVNEANEYLRMNKNMLRHLPLKRRLDYFGVLYCNGYVRFLYKLKGKR